MALPSSDGPRLVLLGASNLLLSLPVAISEAHRVLGPRPAELLVAAGHGRSFGTSSQVGYRRLPSILDCGLWARLEGGSSTTVAVVGDVGNDVAYGQPPERIAGWIEQVLGGLEAVGARTVLCRLPLASLARLGPVRFALVRRLLFPTRRIRRSEALAAAAELDERLERILRERGVEGVVPAAEWYGPDGIHLRPGRWRRAWRSFFAPLGESRPDPGPRPGWWRTVLLPPERRWRLGRELRREQPAATLPGGSQLCLF